MAIGRRFGRELLLDPALGPGERLYARLFGVPVLGLRVRAHYLVPEIDALARRIRPRKVADAGSGRGLLTAHLARAFPEAEVVGFDVDARQVERDNAMVRAAGLANCRFEVRDVTRLEIDEELDLILSTDNLEHLEDDRGQCRIFHRALRPGGWLLVHVPHRTRNLFGWRRENFMEIEGHVRPGYTRGGLTALLEQAGFEVAHTAYSYNSIETLANDLSFLVTGGREKRKLLYALVFPFLLGLAHLGADLGGRGHPKEGSGLLALARRPKRPEPPGGEP